MPRATAAPTTTLPRRWRRGCSRRRTWSTSGFAPRRRGRPLDREPELCLADADGHAQDGGEARDQRVGDGGRERLDQVVPPRLRDVAHCCGDVAVVDGVVDPVVRARVADVELDVVQERLPIPLLVLVDAVEAVDLEAVELESRHQPAPATAAATVSASTCGRTSWTRKIVAPRSSAATAA